LSDVDISSSALNSNNEGLCPQVQADGIWKLGADTTVSGTELWTGLTDVLGTYYAEFGAPGSVWKQDEEDDIVRSALLPGKVKIGASYSLLNYSVGYGLSPYFTGWVEDPYSGDEGYDRVEMQRRFVAPRNYDTFNLKTPGVYKIMFTYSMVSGSISSRPPSSPPLLVTETRIYLLLRPPVTYFPPLESGPLIDEVWWKIIPPRQGQVAPPGTVFANLHLKDGDSGEFGMHVFYLLSKGGSDARVAFGLYQNTELGEKIMDFHVSFERIN
jgi:hypothetical protein